MNESIEDRLRRAFSAEAATIESVAHFHPGPVVRLGGQAREAGRRWRTPAGERGRGKVMIPLAAAAAVTAVTLGITVAIPRQDHAAPGSVAAGALAPGYASGRMPAGPMPKFLVALVVPIKDPSAQPALDVIATSTGRAIARLSFPATSGQHVLAVAAAGSDRRFVVATARGQSCATWFYSFRLTARGRPVGLRPYHAPRISGWADSIAVSKDQSTLAYVTSGCRPNGFHAAAGRVGVIRAATRTMRTWTYHEPALPYSLSLSANGSELEMSSNPSRPIRGNQTESQWIWLLRTDAPAGPLARHWRVVRHRSPAVSGSQPSAISPTGLITYAVSPRYLRHKSHIQWPVMAYRTATGRPLLTIPQSMPHIAITLSASGRYLLAFTRLFSARGTLSLRKLDIEAIDLARRDVILIPPPHGLALESAAW